jgi:hypothetical protein
MRDTDLVDVLRVDNKNEFAVGKRECGKAKSKKIADHKKK